MKKLQISFAMKTKYFKIDKKYFVAAFCAFFLCHCCGCNNADTKAEPLLPPAKFYVITVFDPLAKHSYCGCKDDKDAREYLPIAMYLKDILGERVRNIYPENLESVRLVTQSDDYILCFGKESVVDYEIEKGKFNLRKLGYIVDLNGNTTFHGLLVARKESGVNQVSDLHGKNEGLELILGPAFAVEKNALALKLLKENDIDLSKATQLIDKTCKDTLLHLLRLQDPTQPVVGAISDYAWGLLKTTDFIIWFGEEPPLEIIGKTEPAPFIAVYINTNLDEMKQETIVKALVVSSEKIPDFNQSTKSLGIMLNEETRKMYGL
ncbi:MAG: PhnD/SsuA/transferrin family substrate-binding protein [Thermoguttaceae bacterium]